MKITRSQLKKIIKEELMFNELAQQGPDADGISSGSSTDDSEGLEEIPAKSVTCRPRYEDNGEEVPNEDLTLDKVGMKPLSWRTKSDRKMTITHCPPASEKPPVPTEDFIFGLLQGILIVADFIDPTPFTNGISSALYMLEGDYESAAIVAGAALIPFSVGTAIAKARKVTILRTLEKSGLSKEQARWSLKTLKETPPNTSHNPVNGSRDIVVKTKVEKYFSKRGSNSAVTEVGLGPITTENGSVLEFASKRVFQDDQGRKIVIMKLPGEETKKVFYKSTGTGGSTNSGMWVEIEGLTLGVRSREIWFIKSKRDKMPDAGSLEEYVIDGLIDLERVSPIKTTDMANLGGGFTKTALENAAKINNWIMSTTGKKGTVFAPGPGRRVDLIGSEGLTVNNIIQHYELKESKMKITRSKLRQIIKEELNKEKHVLNESLSDVVGMATTLWSTGEKVSDKATLVNRVREESAFNFIKEMFKDSAADAAEAYAKKAGTTVIGSISAIEFAGISFALGIPMLTVWALKKGMSPEGQLRNLSKMAGRPLFFTGWRVSDNGERTEKGRISDPFGEEYKQTYHATEDHPIVEIIENQELAHELHEDEIIGDEIMNWARGWWRDIANAKQKYLREKQKALSGAASGTNS